jgi:hypothetical protein
MEEAQSKTSTKKTGVSSQMDFAFDINNTSTDSTSSYRAADIYQYFRQLSTGKSEKRAKGFQSVPYAARMAFSRLLTQLVLQLVATRSMPAKFEPQLVLAKPIAARVECPLWYVFV